MKVLGSGCRNCVNTAKLIEDKARALGVDVEIEKVSDRGPSTFSVRDSASGPEASSIRRHTCATITGATM